MKHLLAVLTAVLVYNFTYGQSSKLNRADEYFDKLSYANSAHLYEQLMGTEFESTEMKLRLAYSYYKTGKLDKSEAMYSQVALSEKATGTDYYTYAQVLKQNGKYEESDIWMNRFHKSNNSDYRGQLFAENRSYKEKLDNIEPFFDVKTVDFNSVYSDFGGYFSNDESSIYFLSGRKRGTVIKREWAWSNNNFLDVFKADISQDMKVKKIKRVNKISTKFHEGPLCFTADGTTIYFTRNNEEKGKKKGRDKDGIRNLKVFRATIDAKGKIRNEEVLPFCSRDYSVGHPTLSKDEKTLYFSSDMPGSIGGADIWKVSINSDGSFGTPVNLGKGINTEGNELFPWVDANDNLFYSSDGLLGYGGLDIYIAQNNNGTYLKPENLGAPLNGRSDDFAFTTSKDGKRGFFSSNRGGGKGGDDIYSFHLIRPIVFKATIKGVSKDKKGEIIPYAKVDLKDGKGAVVQTVTSDESGAFTFQSDYDKDYELFGTKTGYFDGAGHVSTRTNHPVVETEVILEKDPGLSLYGLVSDSKTKEPLEGVQIYLIDNFTSKSKSILTPVTGDFREPLYEKKLNDRGSYNLVLRKEGYFSKTVTYNTLFDKPGQYDIRAAVSLALDPQVQDLSELVQLNPINFDLNKFNIRPDAAKELDKIVEVMNKYPHMVVELGAHTDCRGSKKTNELLSQKRATSSAEYIKKRITNPERIFGKGYGESRLLNHCACEGNVKSDCSEEEHAKNRRTEFRVISTGDDKLKVDNTSTDSF